MDTWHLNDKAYNPIDKDTLFVEGHILQGAEKFPFEGELARTK
jgi:hypothetical protein